MKAHDDMVERAQQLFPGSEVQPLRHHTYEQKRDYFFGLVAELYPNHAPERQLELALRALDDLRPEHPAAWDRVRQDLLEAVRR